MGNQGIGAAVIGAVLLCPQVAAAQPETVTIYGNRAASTLEDTQASVAVVTEETIVQKDIQNIRDVFRLMGNVIDSDWVDAGFVIRGVSSEGLTPGLGAPLAAIYVDGAMQTTQGARRGLRGLWDVQQVEVYRGPQSTLSGRAALAGAVYVKTNDPTFNWEYGARATYGTLETAEAAVVLGGPINNAIAFRIAAEYQRRDSDLNYPLYSQYSAYGDFVEDAYYQIRGKLLFRPQAFNGGRAIISYSFAHDSPAYDDIAGPGLGFPYSERRGDLNAGTPFFQANREADTQNVSAEFTYPWSDMLAFTSLSSYSFTDLDRSSINAGTPGEIFVDNGFDKQELATQEFRLNYNAETLKWVLGVYGAYDFTHIESDRYSFFSGGRHDISRPNSRSLNIAAFGEVTYTFVPTWDVIAGGRADYEVRDQFFYSARDFDNPAFTDILVRGRSENDIFAFLPKAGLVKHFTPEQSLGFVVQRGYRSGGAGVNAVAGTAYDYNAEYTWTYELSYRGSFFDNRLRLSANAFYTDWTDQQVEVQLIPGDFRSAVVLNAGSSHLYGGELESQFTITPELSGFISVGYVKTEFDKFITSQGNFSGFPFPESPDWTVSFGAEYQHRTGFFLGADARKVSQYLARDIQNAPVDHVGNYFVANARAGYRGEGWSVTVFSDNLFDEEYFLYKDVSGTFDCCGTLGARRVSGVTLRMSTN